MENIVNKNTELISIIIPVYNTEIYLDKCLKSVINQTYKNIEVICIDDCSIDNSLNILKKYGKIDCRIKIFHNEVNKGIGFVRNLGIKESKGKIIGFVDSDDFVDINMFEILYKKMMDSNSDITICEYYENNKKKNHMSYGILNNEECIYELLNFKIGFQFWNKLFKKSLFDNLEFPYISCYEDVNPVLNLLYKANKIICIENYLYYYKIRENSITHRSFNEYTLLNIRQFEILDEFIYENLRKYHKKSSYLLGLYIFFTLCLAYKSKEMRFRSYLIETRSYCFKYFKYIIFNNLLNVKQKIGFFVKMFYLQYHLSFYLKEK